MKKDIYTFGKKVVERELATSFFGNISVREGEVLTITRTGTMLDELDDVEVVTVPVCGVSPDDATASSELKVHRAIYQQNDCNAILHTHSMHSVLLTKYFGDTVALTIGELLPFLVNVPVVHGKSGSQELADAVAAGLTKNPIVIVHDHGVFAAGKSMKDCYIYISSLEYYAKEYLLRKMLP